MTLKHGLAFSLTTVGIITALFWFGDNALAANKKKLTYDEAWAYCKARLDKEKVPTTTTSNDRWLRGGACMKHFGYTL